MKISHVCGTSMNVVDSVDIVCDEARRVPSSQTGVDLGGIPLSRAPQIFRRNTRFAGTVIWPDYQFFCHDLGIWFRASTIILSHMFKQIKQITIDDFRGACAVKGNGAVAGHVKRVDHDEVFDALLFREETLTRHYFILKFDFSRASGPTLAKLREYFSICNVIVT